MIHKISSPETLGQALRAERKNKGMSQKVVGHSVGMEQHTISKIENPLTIYSSHEFPRRYASSRLNWSHTLLPSR